MASLTPGQIVDALAGNDCNRLIGTDESDQVDFKLAPYQLDENHQKWELAKDVAAFANKRGGVIVIGVECPKRVNEIVETATNIRPVRKAVVNLQQYPSVVDAWIYPRPEGVDFRWYPPDAAEESGLLLIEVPAQRRGNIPFIVRDMREPDAEFKGAIGIPRRDGARIIWETAQDIHRHITRKSSNAGGSPPAQPEIDHARTRVSTIEQQQGWEVLPVYTLQALPPEGPDILDGFYDEVRGSLNNHQRLREAGFAPWQNFDIELAEGGLIARRNDIVTWVEPSGLATHSLLIGENTYLGWYYNEHRAEGAPLIIHPIALVETTLEFFRYVYLQLRPRCGGGAWRFRIACHRLQSNRISLPRGHPTPHNPWAFIYGQPPLASSDEWEREFDEAGSSGRDAFEALQRVYALFGHPPAAIPLVTDNAVSENLLTGLP